MKLDGLHRWVPSLVVALLTALREMAVWQVVGRRVWYIDHVLEVGAVLQPRGVRTSPAPPTPGRRRADFSVAASVGRGRGAAVSI